MLKKIAIISIIVLFLFGSSALAVYFWYRSGGLQKKIAEKIDQRFASSTLLYSASSTTGLAQDLLGFNGAKTYLVLFLNNTEMRPGGGFIGTYAIIQMDKGTPNILKVEGTEVLDNYSSRTFQSVPPYPLREYLGIKRWEFRDSNWSPDFASSTIKSLELYSKENGLLADKIDMVIGFTPTVIEELLKIIGPIKLHGIEFTASNFTEQLEYEVEYDYKKRGVKFDERKKITGELADILFKKVASNIFLNWSKYLDLTNKMIKEKQVLAYAVDEDIQKIITFKNFDGQIKDKKGDYIMWVDANLGALKTDAYISRQIFYNITPANGKFLATLKIKFIHSGSYDWRSTKYLDYARLYAPLGSKFVSVEGASVNVKITKELLSTNQGIEHNKQWYGAFLALPPERTGEITWQYYLPLEIVDQIKNGTYTLFVQKQLGVINSSLTLNLDFGKNIISAIPAEDKSKYGDTKYEYKGDLREDKEFIIQIKP